jgi:hypothetical protein
MLSAAGLAAVDFLAGLGFFDLEDAVFFGGDFLLVVVISEMYGRSLALATRIARSTALCLSSGFRSALAECISAIGSHRINSPRLSGVFLPAVDQPKLIGDGV